MEIYSNFREEAIEYMKPILENIDSIKLVPPNELVSEDQIYPTSEPYLTEEELVIQPAREDKRMNLAEFYNQIPSSLEKLIVTEPYKHPNREGLVCTISMKNSQVDQLNDSIRLKGVSLDQLEDFVNTIKDDLEYLNDREELIKIIQSDSTSALIKVHRDLLVQSSNHQSLMGYQNIMTHIGRRGLHCNKVLEYSEPYYTLLVRPRKKNDLQTTRHYFIRSHKHSISMVCPECKEDGVTVSNKNITYCTSCEEVLNKVDVDDIGLTETISDFTEHNWMEYSEALPIDEGVLEITEDDVLTGTQDDRLIYMTEHGPFPKQDTLYVRFKNHLLPFHSGSKELREDGIVYKPETCYMCAEHREKDHYIRIEGVFVTIRDVEFCQDCIYICGECKRHIERKSQNIFENAQDLDSKLLSRKI